MTTVVSVGQFAPGAGMAVGGEIPLEMSAGLVVVSAMRSVCVTGVKSRMRATGVFKKCIMRG
jgi:hypothetical protein